MEDYKHNTCDGLRHQGIMTISLKAYCPYGKLLPSATTENAALVGTAIVGIAVVSESRSGADNETVILIAAQMPSPPYVLTNTVFYVYNPGTEPTPLNIVLAGSATTGTITNVTNGQSCVIKGLTAAMTTDVNKTLRIDSETGRVTLDGATSSSLAFDLHDYGYINLAPSTPFLRGVTVSYTSGSNIITTDGRFMEDLVGQFVYLHGQWRKIAGYTDANTMTLESAMDATGSEFTNVVTMNELHFDGFTLSKLEMTYTPRMR